MPVHPSDVLSAARTIRGGALRTPVLRSAWLDAAAAHPVHCKAEHLQHTGSFKFRGALNALSLLARSGGASAGVVCHSTGNHAAALAAAAAYERIPCAVVMPHDTPSFKVAHAAAFGARVDLCEPTQAARRERRVGFFLTTAGLCVLVPLCRTLCFHVFPFGTPM